MGLHASKILSYLKDVNRAEIPAHSATSSLKCEGGVVRVPSGPGPGFGIEIEIDPAFVREAKRATAS